MLWVLPIGSRFRPETYTTIYLLPIPLHLHTPLHYYTIFSSILSISWLTTLGPLNNGIGVIIRDHQGRMLKGFTGTIRGLSPMAIQLWSIHLGLNQARLANCDILTLETDNFNAYFEIVRKDGNGDMVCYWIVEQIKKLLGYNPEWENKIYFVAESANRSAHYLAAVGLNNWDAMHLVLKPFGRLQEKLDLDMGFGPPISQLLISPIHTYANGFVRGFAPTEDMVVYRGTVEVQDFQSDNGIGVAAAA